MPQQPRIVRLEIEHLEQLAELLRQHGLPDDDCAEQAGSFVGVFDGSKLVAAGGLEAAGDYALLRSVVVDRAYRSHGLARSITLHLLEQAAQQKYREVYLLTESAASYFESLGFSRVERGGVPPAVAATRQFAALCPASAVCMSRRPDPRVAG